MPEFRGSSKVGFGFVASLDVKTAFDVAKPGVVSRISTRMGTHGHVVTALLEEMTDWDSACSENWEAAFRHSRCMR